MALQHPTNVLHLMVRDFFTDFYRLYQATIRGHRGTSQNVTAAAIDGLAGVCALTIVARHGSKEVVVEKTIALLREAIDRDLAHFNDVRT
jgi:hypothetical protein